MSDDTTAAFTPAQPATEDEHDLVKINAPVKLRCGDGRCSCGIPGDYCDDAWIPPASEVPDLQTEAEILLAHQLFYDESDDTNECGCGERAPQEFIENYPSDWEAPNTPDAAWWATHVSALLDRDGLREHLSVTADELAKAWDERDNAKVDPAGIERVLGEHRLNDIDLWCWCRLAGPFYGVGSTSAEERHRAHVAAAVIAYLNQKDDQ